MIAVNLSVVFDGETSRRSSLLFFGVVDVNFSPAHFQ